ncbi:Myotubularin- protein 14 [Lunasporangiospora selenospora]|uniref:Myotubularin- protein 14 n=1 Tax=Lunasporangiospora selenospora TaxID=979761 RepID=A0A9P6FSY1_9FUNG|nr:Myotubularin- protein 14 [Lunasporangiospora selenospora]
MDLNDTQELAKQFEKSHFARVRARFVVPCILVRNKNICRSATLSNEVEVFMHSFNQKINDLNQRRKMFLYGTGEKSPDKEDRESSLEKQRLEDIDLLHQLGVTYINDLMVENRKVKYGLKVTSSEKADSFGRYSKFKLVATPYPGVEFFQKFKANKYSARKLRFDWSQTFADAELQLPPGHRDQLNIRWCDYKNWDLRWDRTPLFISLLRISLWADGEAHQSLSAAEILYLTMGYDWFLFNHLLADRSQRGEDIFYFCFYFLKFIYGDEFSLKSISEQNSKKADPKPTRGMSPSLPMHGKDRQTRSGNDPLEQIARRDMDLTGNNICDECRVPRRSPNEPLGRNAATGSSIPKSHNDVASSTDGKASSWQLVTFATPPGKDRPNGSPRAPMVPGLQSSSRVSGSPLGMGRLSRHTGFQTEESPRSTEGQSLQRSQPPHETIERLNHPNDILAATADYRGRSSNGQPSNARRSSASSIPDVFDSESRRQMGGVEFSRVAVSPYLPSADTLGKEMHEGTPEDDADSLGRQSLPRKRASTFDGGLLLNFGADAASTIDPNSKEHEDDLTSGDEGSNDDSRTNNGKHGPPESVAQENKPEICQLCHRHMPSGPMQGRENRATMIDNGSLALNSLPRDSSHQASNMGPTLTVVHTMGNLRPEDAYYGCDEDGGPDYHSHPPDFRPSELDRDENMFQMEFDDRLSTLHYEQDLFRCGHRLGSVACQKLHKQQRPNRVSKSAGCSHESLLGKGDSLWTEDQHPSHGHVRETTYSTNGPNDCTLEADESFWYEASTFDYECSPSSLIGDVGPSLDEYCENGGSQIDKGARLGSIGATEGESMIVKTRVAGVPIRSTGVDQGDDLEEEEEEDDDGVASLNSHQSCPKTIHENDHLFMPSLKGVFSANGQSIPNHRGENTMDNGSDHHRHGSLGRRVSSSGPKGESVGTAARGVLGDRRTSVPNGGNASSHNDSSQHQHSYQQAEPSSDARILSRRQKLRQLRQLFMDIRNEIGDGVA